PQRAARRRRQGRLRGDRAASAQPEVDECERRGDAAVGDLPIDRRERPCRPRGDPRRGRRARPCDLGGHAHGARRGWASRMSPARQVALVVDDSAVNRKVLGRHLATLEIEALEAANGREALDTLGADGSGVDIVLLDIEMPELDGYETLSAIK